MFISYFLFVLGLITLPLAASGGNNSNAGSVDLYHKYLHQSFSMEYKSKLCFGMVAGYTPENGLELYVDKGAKQVKRMYLSESEFSKQCNPLPSPEAQARVVRKLFKNYEIDALKFRNVIRMNSNDLREYGMITSSIRPNFKMNGFLVEILFENGKKRWVALDENVIIL